MESVAGSTKTKSTNDVDEDFFAALTRQLSRRVHMKAFFRELCCCHRQTVPPKKCIGELEISDYQSFMKSASFAEELRKSLWAKNVPAKVYVGTRYWHPFTEEAIEQVFDNLDLSLQCELGYHFINFVLLVNSLPCSCPTI
ncbi:ferrochelatase-2, chloroplastic isoform X2 [Senna tora]|uniref:Ferrochelatase-2, chloroplastic isoform X2 n=1 Tax=Senna tora TaxID=362788 RepID=A0A834WT89_9FABA|nr:ferrochelatase-2, chloroplastic isoform X2 [Senna tora]